MRKRETRSDPGGARVMARDLRALALVALAQPVTTSQVARFLAMSVPMARRRLRALRDLGLVSVVVPQLDAENKIVLARGGALLLCERGLCAHEPVVLRGISRIQLQHHSAGVDFYVALTRACSRSTRLRLVRFAFEDELRRIVGDTAKGAQVPDAVAVVERGIGRIALAIEVDRSTENPSFIVNRKAIPYERLRRDGYPLLGESAWAVGFVVPDERRRNRLAVALHEAGVAEGLFFFIVDQDVDDRRVLASGWHTIRTGAEAALLKESPFVTVSADRVDGEHGLGDGNANEAPRLHDEARRE